MNRNASFERKTDETDIAGYLNIDGKGKAEVTTGIGFLDHMLELWTFHSGFDLKINCVGDLSVCPHHSIEDIALILGNTFSELLGDKKGIERYAVCYLPMDETLSRTVIDISGRFFHIFTASFSSENVGDLPTEMVKHFFYSFAMNSKITLHQEILYGENDHHKIESLFKGFARSLSAATAVSSDRIPSSKGVL